MRYTPAVAITNASHRLGPSARMRFREVAVAILGVRSASLSPFSPRGMRPQAATSDGRRRTPWPGRRDETIVDHGDCGRWRDKRRSSELAVVDRVGTRSGPREYLPIYEL